MSLGINTSAPPPGAIRLLKPGPVLLILLSLTPSHLFAQGGDLDKKTTSFFLQTEVLFSAHRSETINATDFGTEYGIQLGNWAGKSKMFGLGINMNSNVTKFTQNNASMSTAWTEFFVKTRLWWFFPYISMGTCQVKTEQDDVELMNALCTTTGGGLDVKIPVGASVLVDLGADVAAVNHIRDRVDSGNSIGPRSAFHFGVAIYPKLDWLSIGGGFRYRVYHLKIAGTKNKEVETGPFAGVNLNLDF